MRAQANGRVSATWCRVTTTVCCCCQVVGSAKVYKCVHVFAEPTTVQGVSFPRGSLLLRVADNTESLHDAVAAAAKEQGVVVHGVDSAFVDDGASFGGPNVRWVKPPRVLLMTDRPADYSVGHTWYLFDQVWRYPVTRIAGRSLPGVDWSKFDVCILPHGAYKGADFRRPRTRHMSAQGLGVRRRHFDPASARRPGPPATRSSFSPPSGWYKKSEEDKKDDAKEEKKDGKAKDDKPLPLEVPGVVLRAVVDNDHFRATWGIDKETNLLLRRSPLHPAQADCRQEPSSVLLTAMT